MTEVTIVIPIFNRAAYLPRLFDSLLGVNYQGKHAILVDNGSSDESFHMCQVFADNANFPVQVILEPQKGASVARNTGLMTCSTEWVYFFDSDDELSPDFLNLVTPCCADNDCVFMPTVQVEKEREMIRPYQPTGDAGYQILSSMLNSPSMLFRTSWLRQIGGWNSSLTVWDDWELGVRTLLSRPRFTWFTAKAFHKLYVHDESITGPAMSHNFNGKMDCLLTVYEQLNESSHKKALYLHKKIIEGKIRREGCSRVIDIFEREVPWFIRFVGCILCLYTRFGGRGGWRIATWFVNP